MQGELAQLAPAPQQASGGGMKMALALAVLLIAAMMGLAGVGQAMGAAMNLLHARLVYASLLISQDHASQCIGNCANDLRASKK